MVTTNKTGGIDAYPNSRTDFVVLEDNKQVKHFLKQVIKENPSIFGNVSAVQVMAYRTDDDAKNATSPLGTSHPLKVLGEDEANALVVVVPESYYGSLIPVD